MKYRALGKSDVKVSEISFGCWTMGGLSWIGGQSMGWAEVDEDEITRAIKLAVDKGVNHFDNADTYGTGKAERMLARVIDRLGLKSTDFVFATKIGHFPGTMEHAYLPANIRHQCEASLINLRRDYIDVYYFHHGNFGEGAKYLEGAAQVMDDLVKQGKVRLKGQSAYSQADFLKAVPVVQPEVLQSWAHAMDDQFIRPGSPVANLMAERGLTFVCFSPLEQGLLLGKYNAANPPKFEPGDHRQGSKMFAAENLTKMAPKIEKLKSRFGATIEDLASVALNYCLAMPNVACVIPGFRNVTQATCNLAAQGRALSAEDVSFVREVMAG